MKSPVALLFRLMVAGIACTAAPWVGAQLTSKSPFMAPQAAATSAPTESAPLKYVGYMETASEGRLFRIHDPAKKTSTWVKLNERNADFDVVAKQHDEAQKTLTIEYQGKVITLPERESKVVSAGSAAQVMPPPVMATNVAPAVTQTVRLNPTPADEQLRLQAVADEVARRRALREQATQNVNAPTAVPLPQNVQNAQQPAANFQAVPMQPQQNIQIGNRAAPPATRQ
jgi:hypothetical protein